MRNSHIEISPIAGALGAEIGGVTVAQDLDDVVISEICQALSSVDEGLLVLVLLCHKLRDAVCRWQQGQRGSVLASPRVMVMRMVVIDVATWRSGRIGGAAGSVACA